jgi:hypothetical protein
VNTGAHLEKGNRNDYSVWATLRRSSFALGQVGASQHFLKPPEQDSDIVG